MKTNFPKFLAVCSMVALVGAGCLGTEPAPTNTNTNTPPAANNGTKPTDTSTKPSDTKPADTTTPSDTTTPPTSTDTSMSPDRDVAPSELPVIDSSWKTYNNTALNFSFQYPTKGRFAPEWNVAFLQEHDATLSGGCVNPQTTPRTPNDAIIVGDSTFCIVREVDAGAGQRYFTDTYTVPRSERIVKFTFTKRLANGDLFEDENCHGKVVISSGTTCIPFDEALYRAHLNQIIATYRHE
jgi:hypothetical protein